MPPRLIIALMSLMTPLLALASDRTPEPSPSEIREFCEQPIAARVRIAGVGINTPEPPCEGGVDPKGCQAVVAEVVVLESLPATNGGPGLSVRSPDPRQRAQGRYLFRVTPPPGAASPAPPLDLVGVKALMSAPAMPGYAGTPEQRPLATFLRETSTARTDLDTLCKPYRPWQGLRSTGLPEELPGRFPARLEAPPALGRRLATLVRQTPPSVADIEHLLGTRMVEVRPASPGRSARSTVSRLAKTWIQIEREEWRDRPGPPSVVLDLALSAPFAAERSAPWWLADPSDTGPAFQDCVTSDMVVKALDPGWAFSPVSLPYRGRFSREFPQYSVMFEFTPPYIHTEDLFRGGVPQRCIRQMRVYYFARGAD